MFIKRIMTLFFLVLALKFVLAVPTYAYLDPGSGSFLIQIILGGLLAGLYLLKIYWKRLRAFFGGRSQDLDQND